MPVSSTSSPPTVTVPISMPVEPYTRNRFVGDFIWSQEPYRDQRRAGRPVYVVTEDA